MFNISLPLCLFTIIFMLLTNIVGITGNDGIVDTMSTNTSSLSDVDTIQTTMKYAHLCVAIMSVLASLVYMPITIPTSEMLQRHESEKTATTSSSRTNNTVGFWFGLVWSLVFGRLWGRGRCDCRTSNYSRVKEICRPILCCCDLYVHTSFGFGFFEYFVAMAYSLCHSIQALLLVLPLVPATAISSWYYGHLHIFNFMYIIVETMSYWITLTYQIRAIDIAKTSTMHKSTQPQQQQQRGHIFLIVPSPPQPPPVFMNNIHDVLNPLQHSQYHQQSPYVILSQHGPHSI